MLFWSSDGGVESQKCQTAWIFQATMCYGGSKKQIWGHPPSPSTRTHHDDYKLRVRWSSIGVFCDHTAFALLICWSERFGRDHWTVEHYTLHKTPCTLHNRVCTAHEVLKLKEMVICTLDAGDNSTFMLCTSSHTISCIFVFAVQQYLQSSVTVEKAFQMHTLVVHM